MVKVWVNTRKGLEQVEIRKIKGSKEYEYVKKKRIRKKIVKRATKKYPIKKILKKKPIKNIRLKGIKKKETKTRKISEVFKKSISKTTIRNFLDISTNEINLQYKPLLKEVMNKKELGDLMSEEVLNAMIKQENINKIKWRFELRTNVYDRDGTKVLEMVKGSGGDLMTLKEKMKKGVWRGANVDYDIDVGEGYVFRMINKGNVDRVEVTIVFRS